MLNGKPGLLLFYPYMEVMCAGIADRFRLIRTWEETDPEGKIDEIGAEVVAILSTGHDYAINDKLFDRLPNLRTVVAVGAGYAGIDVAAARKRGIVVTNAGDTHSGDVADHAVALAFALVQQFTLNDRWVRDGSWAVKAFPAHRPSLSAQRFGILGLGRIGRAVAQRLAPFGGEIAWWGPNARNEPWPRMASPRALAEWATVLIVAARGDAGVIVDREIVAALAPNGFIVNVARGGLIDEDSLIAALREGRLAGAGLDVFQTEPTPPARWKDVPNTILSAHSAGLTIEAMARLRDAARTNLKTALDGGTVLNELIA